MIIKMSDLDLPAVPELLSITPIPVLEQNVKHDMELIINKP